MFLAALFSLVAAVVPPSDPRVPSDPPSFEARVVAPEGQDGTFSQASTLVALPGGTLMCAWQAGKKDTAQDTAVHVSVLEAGATTWSDPRVLVDTPHLVDGNPVLHYDKNGVLWLFYVSAQGGEWSTSRIKVIASTDQGASWSDARDLSDVTGLMTRHKPVEFEGGVLLLPVYDAQDWTSLMLLSRDGGHTWTPSGRIDTGLGSGKGAIEPSVVERGDGSLLCFLRDGSDHHRVWQSVSMDHGHTWSAPCPVDIPNPNSSLEAIRLEGGHLMMALNPTPKGTDTLSVWISQDDGMSWQVFRDIEHGQRQASCPAILQGADGLIHLTYCGSDGSVKHVAFNESWAWQTALLGGELTLMNVLPPLDLPPREGGLRNLADTRTLPYVDAPFIEHVRGVVSGAPEGEALDVAFDEGGRLLVATRSGVTRRESDGAWAPMNAQATDPPAVKRLFTRVERAKAGDAATGAYDNAVVTSKDEVWIGRDAGLYRAKSSGGQEEVVDIDGPDGPPSRRITALHVDASGMLWVGTSEGIALFKDGAWRRLTGRDGLPYDNITAFAAGADGRLWIGTTRGVILHVPGDAARAWYYRAGLRYLPGDQVNGLAETPDGTALYVATDGGVGRIDFVERTLFEKAEIIEKRLNARHRRYGLVAEARLDNAMNPTSHTISDNDNDGLWTAYHVAAMSLAYGATGNEAYKKSAMESMHAVVMLQNASGVPGLVARSVLPPEEGRQRNENGNRERLRRGLPTFDQWRPTPDGSMYWKSDTSSDEIDGHYLALYTYYRHIAQFDPEERALIQKQANDLTNYIVDNNYQLIDWTGKRTRWGFWNPENLNGDPEHYIETGLNSLQMLSFLKTAHYITGNPKFKEHAEHLILKHGYLNNVLLQKKVYPDEHNHSDDQLGFVAWYPILQLERDPRVRHALQLAVRRHYVVVMPEDPSFYIFAHATIDPDHTDLEAGVRNLREISTDRRDWRMENSHRTDVVFDPRADRFGCSQLLRVLPADERDFDKWNGNPYIADGGGQGLVEDDGAAYLLPYWMARFHGFLSAPKE